MNQNTLFVFATIYPKKECYTQVEKSLLGIVDNTKKEKGCIEFRVHQNLKQSKLFLYEEWSDENALLSHHKELYTLDVLKKFESWLDKPTDIVKMKKLK